MRHSRLLVWRRPKNDLWNNTHVCVLHKPGQCVDQYLRTTVDSCNQPTPMEIGAMMSTCGCSGKAGNEKAVNVRNLLASQVPRVAVARVLAKAARAVETQTNAVVVEKSVVDDLRALVETKVAVSVENVDI